MKAARVVVLGVAIAAGGVAAYLAAGGKAPPPAPVVQLETVDVLVAKTDLVRGQVIEGKDIGWQAWPTDAANPGFVRKSGEPNALSKYTGAIVRVAMLAGDPVRSPYVVLAKGSGFLAAVLTKGMRAAAVDISPESGAGGFILPDDRVDVMLTRRDKAAEKATGVERLHHQHCPAKHSGAGCRPDGRSEKWGQDRDRQDRDARTHSAASRDARAVAAGRFDLSYAAQHPRFAGDQRQR